jgi:hypothetical protein
MVLFVDRVHVDGQHEHPNCSRSAWPMRCTARSQEIGVRTVSKRFWRGCLWGIVATLAMTVVSLLAWQLWPRAVPAPLPLAISVGIVARVFNAQPMTPEVLVLGGLLQFAYGSFWGGFIEISTARASVWKGIVVALGLWLMMIIFYMPMAGLDVFDVATSGGIWITTLVGHVIYGYTVGRLLVRDQRKVPPPPEPEEVAAV